MASHPFLKRIRIFAASPGDVHKERECLGKVIEEINNTIAPFHGFVLELVKWETHCRPEMGRPQGIVNTQIGYYDIFVGIMWRRFGTPTGSAESGTEEEFRIAYDAWQQKKSPSILFYFCQEPFNPRCKAETDQCGKVLEFREELSKKGLIWEYETHETFSDTIRPHLIRMLLENTKETSETIPPPTAFDHAADDLRPPHYYERE